MSVKSKIIFNYFSRHHFKIYLLKPTIAEIDSQELE